MKREQLFWRLLQPEIRQLALDLKKDLGDAIGQLHARGQLQSGQTAITLRQIGVASLRLRAAKVWECVRRAVGEPFPHDFLSVQQIKIVVNRAVEQQKDQIARDVEAVTPKNLLHVHSTDLDAESLAQQERISAEIDLLVEELREADLAGPALAAAMEDLGNDLGELARSEWQHVDPILRRMVGYFADNMALGVFVKSKLPQVDFDAWFDRATRSGGIVMGNATLDWPTARVERMAMQLGMLRHAAAPNVGIRGAAIYFFSGNHPQKINGFIRQVIVPFFEDLQRLTKVEIGPAPEDTPTIPAPRRTGTPAPFVSPERIEELRQASGKQFDARKLVRLCEELNLAWEHRAFYTVGVLTRAILDHVPPAFGFRTFKDVAGQHGGQSFKKVAGRLDETSRGIAGDFLHMPLRPGESLPNDRTVDASVELDYVLGEVERLVR